MLAIKIQQGVMQWLSLRINLLSIMLMAIIASACVLLRADVPPEEKHINDLGIGESKEALEPIVLSMLLGYVLTIQTNLVWLLKYYVQIESNMINAERCMSLTDIPSERLKDPDTIKVSRDWPTKGVIKFCDVSMRYRAGTDVVLDQMSFTINPAEKIGIVGRTGAGKSSLGLALTRIVEIFEGKILIDDVDISKVPLKTLRRQVTVIPQDPTLFTGTLRFNLDPDTRYSDDFLVDVLRKAGLYRILRTSEQGLLQPITEGGQNFSAGERQLLCICRAILRKSRLVIMDEATAFIDMITEQKIQELIS